MGITALIISLLAVFTIIFFYKRYVPVWGLQEWDVQDGPKSNRDIILVDTRDYQTSSTNKVQQAYSLPLPYINRHYHDLPQKDIIIISSDHVEKNLSARILKRKGLRVIGYYVANEMEKE